MLTLLGNKTRSVLLCHNVTRHEAQSIDKRLVKALFKRVDAVLVHSTSQAKLAAAFRPHEIIQADLPPVLPPRKQVDKPKKLKLKKHLLFFGIVRHYKGLDVLISALANISDVRLTVAGEVWGDAGYQKQVNELKLGHRVVFLDNYTPDDQLEELFLDADALVLPYRGGTATFNVDYAHYYHRPVIATTAGTLAQEVNDDVDGILCRPDDSNSLADAIKHFYEPGVADKLLHGIEPINPDKDWAKYVQHLV